MDYDYLQYPQTIVALAEEIKRIINDYNARKISNSELKEILLWYASKCPDKLFNGGDYNTSIKKIIGKKRIEILNMVFDGYQFKP